MAHVLRGDLEPARRSPLVRQRRRGDTLSATKEQMDERDRISEEEGGDRRRNWEKGYPRLCIRPMAAAVVAGAAEGSRGR